MLNTSFPSKILYARLPHLNLKFRAIIIYLKTNFKKIIMAKSKFDIIWVKFLN
jgi:hypothetical protein